MAIKIRPKSTLAEINKVDYAVLLSKTNLYEWKNKQKVSDDVIGVQLDIAMQNCRYAILSVKFDKDPIPTISDVNIDEQCQKLSPYIVKIPDCTIEFYPTEKKSFGMTATAKTAQIVTLRKNTDNE